MKSVFYEALQDKDIFPICTVAFHPPATLITSTYVDTIVNFRRNQAKQTHKVMANMSKVEAGACKERPDADTQALRAYYQQPQTSRYN